MNLTAVIETTENCNLNCTFCLRPSFKKPNMSIETLEKVIAHFLEYAEKRVDFIWHGGEPLIAGIDFFRKIPEFQKKHNKRNIIIKNNVQTNGTFLNKEFREFFEKEGFAIGTSIQGTKEIHDSSRIDKGGNPTFEKVISNISKLQSKPSAILVLTKEIWGKEEEIYNEIKKYVRGIRISEYFPGGIIPNKNRKCTDSLEPLMPTSKEYGESMIRFYEAWKKDSNPIEIRPIAEMIRAFIQGECGSCLYSQKSCNFSVIGIKANGDFFTCMRSAPDKQFKMGNVDENPLKNYKESARRVMDQRIKNLKENGCNHCEFWNQCNGGCPQESLKIYGDLNHKPFYCEGRKMLFKEIKKDLEKLK